jgi:hypothetical protein
MRPFHSCSWPSMQPAQTRQRTSTLWPALEATSGAGTPALRARVMPPWRRSYGRAASGVELALVQDGAAVGPPGRDALGRAGEGEPAPACVRELAIAGGQGGGFSGAQVGVVQAGEERGELGSLPGDRVEEPDNLRWAGDDAAVCRDLGDRLNCPGLVVWRASPTPPPDRGRRPARPGRLPPPAG